MGHHHWHDVADRLNSTLSQTMVVKGEEGHETIPAARPGNYTSRLDGRRANP
jgi:hypothetical protein